MGLLVGQLSLLTVNNLKLHPVLLATVADQLAAVAGFHAELVAAEPLAAGCCGTSTIAQQLSAAHRSLLVHTWQIFKCTAAAYAAVVAVAAEDPDAYQAWAVAAIGAKLGSLLNAAASAMGMALVVLLYWHNRDAGGCLRVQLALENCVVFTTSCIAHGLICFCILMTD